MVFTNDKGVKERHLVQSMAFIWGTANNSSSSSGEVVCQSRKATRSRRTTTLEASPEINGVSQRPLATI